MYGILVIVLILDALVLTAAVLLQAGQGGGLASLGGGTTDTVLGGRQAVTILTKMSWWCGGLFMLLSLVLSLTPRGAGSSGLQERLRAASPAAPSPQAPLPLGTPTEPSGAPAQPGAQTQPATPAPAGRTQLPLGAPSQPSAPATKAPTTSQPAPKPQK